MKFSIAKEKLQNIASIVQKATTSTSTIDALQCIKIEVKDEIVMTANNLEISIIGYVDGDIKSQGEVLINAKIFCEIVRKMTGDEVTIEVKNNKAKIISGGSKFDICVISSDDEFPESTNVSEKVKLTIPQNQLKTLIKGTAFAVSDDPARPVLNGCFIHIKENRIKFVAVDGFRLAIRELQLDKTYEEQKLIVPGRSLNELLRIIEDVDDEIEIIADDKNVQFRVDGIQFISRLIDGQYIDYEKLIPVDFKTHISVDKRDLEKSIDRAALIIINESTKCPVEIDIGEKVLISCVNQLGDSVETLDADKKGEDLHIGFNHRFMMDVVRACEDEKIFLQFNNPTDFCLITSVEKDESYKYMIVPMRLTKSK